MATTAHRDEQIVRPCKRHCLCNVRRPDTTRNERRPPVEGAVPHLARLVVTGLSGEEKFATEAPLQIRHVRGRERRLLTVAADDGDFAGYRCGSEGPERQGARGCQCKRGGAKDSSFHVKT